MSTETLRAVMHLASEKPEWVRILRAAREQARKTAPFGGEFCGAWVLREVEQQTGIRPWVPGLRTLAAYGLIEKVGESVRGGKRTYYRMTDPEGVDQGLAALDGLHER